METESYRPLSPEEQFERTEIVDVNGEKLEIVDVTPGIKKNETAVFVAAGWVSNAETVKKNILGVVESGRRTLSVQNEHGVASSEGEDTEAELRKAEALIQSIQAKNLDQVDAIAMSEGAIYLTSAASMYPEKFRNIVLVNPGGMVGKDNLWGLVKRFTSDVIQQDKSKESLELSTQGIKALLKNPSQAVKQAVAISETQIHEKLRELKEKGIGISIIHGVDDKAFPMDKIQEIAKADMIDGFYSVKGTHNQFILEPEKYTRLAVEALNALENKPAQTSKAA